MAIVTRYFDASGNGAADGTSWADRAALFSAGNWSSVITGFSFAGSDSLRCLINGSHTCGQTLASGLFTNAPTVANPLLFHGCDSSGNVLSHPDPAWQSCEPDFDDSTLPVIATTTNIATSSLSFHSSRLIKYTASGRTGGSMFSSANADFYSCVVENTTAGASVRIADAGDWFNCVMDMSGSTQYLAAILGGSGRHYNCRMIGNPSASAGYGYRVTAGSASPGFILCTVARHPSGGIVSASTNTSQSVRIVRCVVANNTGSGIVHPNAAVLWQIEGCMITGNGAYGVDEGSQPVALTRSRLRDNTSGNIGNTANYPTDWDIYTTDSDDATEYVDASSTFDFTIKSGATIHGSNYGVTDQAAAGGGGYYQLGVV